MEVEFRTKKLRSRYQSVREATKAWGNSVGRSYITLINAIYAAETLNDLRPLRAYRLHALKGNRQGQYSLKLDDRMSLIVTYDEVCRVVTILEVSKHYGD